MERITIPYGDHPSQQMDAYIPEQINRDTSIFIYYHGGGWRIGNKDDEGVIERGLEAIGRVYDITNTIAISVEYRKTGEATEEYPNRSPDITQDDIMDDCRSALRHVIDLAEMKGVSTENVSIGGTSAGGWICANIITNPDILGREYHDKIDNVILNCAVYDQAPFFDIVKGDYQWINNPDLFEWYQTFAGDTVPYNNNAQSNIFKMKGSAMKLYMTHGVLDPLVIIEQADIFHASMLAIGIEVKYNRLPNSTHALEELYDKSDN